MNRGYRLSAIGLALAASLQGQATVPNSTSPAEPGSELTVTLLTYEQGGQVYERYGHNAIWIHDAVTGADDHYDYGRFNFQEKGFLLQFIQGRMWYSMGHESNVAGMVDLYVKQGRRVWMQELTIPPAERLKLRDFLAWNMRPENKNYAYDYYRDNCSTRIRDALDRALGGAIRRFGEHPSGLTWRDETRRLNQHNPVLYTMLLVVLGHPVDAEMSRWQQMFLPMRLREYLDSMSVAGPESGAPSVVRSERVISEGGSWPAPERASNRLPAYLVLGAVGGVLMALVGRTRGFLPVATLWTLLVGLLGGFMLWAWIWSYHVAGYRNENLFLFNLFALALAVVLPGGLRGRAWAVRPARWLATALVGCGGLGLLLKSLPWFRQHNLEVIALILPVHLGVWSGVRRRIPAIPSS